MEIDHVFIATPSHEEANAFFNLGFNETQGRRHAGQGTKNRIVRFNNVFLEFLYLVDKHEATSSTTSRTQLYQRLTPSRHPTVSPFGVCFRPSINSFSFTMEYWDYKPSYLPNGVSIPVSTQGLEEPMWFFLSFGKAPSNTLNNDDSLIHKNGAEHVTNVQLHCAHFSDETKRTLSDIDQLTLLETQRIEDQIEESHSPNVPPNIHLLELELDNGRQGKTYDLRPNLPLIVSV
ncbi:VOC family protein [Marinomonas mediterranea]|uniref:VOC family protein n=1 Tax=Marinomonas mediterranea TaxID=119864 RepID=UPI00234972CC|nr:VOC family protein [Marinomonas mediterranea]WCN09827.1 hypothetical protein GV055_13330 [Marinomonas mediterranea]WCN13911.1 hypothetical protein GV054_13345 [Marinomonas mediterranea]